MSISSLSDCLSNVYACLSDFALTESFWGKFESIYGTEYDLAKAEVIQSRWASGDFGDLPPIEIVSGEVLGSAVGAYAASNNTIYLSDLFLRTASTEQVVTVILEEIGHFVDALINTQDSPGDEGEIFAAFAQNIVLSPTVLEKLIAQADQAAIMVDDQLIWVETSNGSTPAPPMLARPEDRSRFQVTTFATGLNFPTSMTTLADGSLLVATSLGGNNSFLFGSSSGRLVRLVDADNNGVADGQAQLMADGLPGLVTSVRRVGNLVAALSSQNLAQAITFWRTGDSPGDSFSPLGRLNFTFPSGFEHTTYALATRQSPDIPGAIELYFNVGSKANSSSTLPADTVGLAGSGDINFASAVLNADSIYRVLITDTGFSLNVGVPLQIATG